MDVKEEGAVTAQCNGVVFYFCSAGDVTNAFGKRIIIASGEGAKGMMSHEQMMGNMTDMMNELSGLMGRMSDMMKNMPKENMHQMSSMMRDTCSEMNRMSEIMDKDTATDEEIKVMHDRIMEIKKRITEIKQ